MSKLCTTPECPCSENPLANLTSEVPDKQVFIGIYWSFIDPFIGKDWTAVQCGKTCQSSVSQQEADACAQNLADRCVLCSPPNPECPPVPDCPPPGVDCPAPACPPPFCNVPQGCQNSQFSSQIAGGQFYAHTQADADAIAASVCQHQLLTGPRTPNAPNCPIILGIFPPSPVHANQGETVLLSASIQYSGSGPLTFLWFWNSFPLANTPTAALLLTNVQDSDSGSYVLQVSAPGCEAVLSPSLTLDVVNNCVPDSGTLPPSGLTPLEIMNDVEWETFSVSPSDFAPVVSSNPICNPTGYSFVTWTGQPTHPPGTYELEYVSGFFKETIPSCGDIVCGHMGFYQLWDTEHNYDNPVVCNGFQALRDGFSFCSCQGASRQGSSDANVQAQYAIFVGKRYDLFNLLGNNFHSLTGGDFSLEWDESAFPPITDLTVAPGYEITFKVWQVTGLLEEPEKLAITDWDTVKTNLSSSIALNWNGQFDTRTQYSQTQAQWEAPPSGAFAGAVCSYSQSIPISPNGCGWVLEIYSAGPVLEWRGFKTVNDTSDGEYILDPALTHNLGCVHIFDNT